MFHFGTHLQHKSSAFFPDKFEKNQGTKRNAVTEFCDQTEGKEKTRDKKKIYFGLHFFKNTCWLKQIFEKVDILPKE